MVRKKITKKVDKPKTKTTAKRVSKTAAEAKEQIPVSIPENTSKKVMSVKIHKSSLIIAAVIIILGAFLYLGRGFLVAAVVNGQPISRISVVKEAEKQSGKQVLSILIRNILVEQEAKRLNVEITDKEIDNQIKTVEDNLSKQGQKLDEMLEFEGMSRNDLKKAIRLDLIVTKIIEKDIKISDKEVEDYIEKNKDILPKDQEEDKLKKTVRERLKQQQLSQKAQTWLTSLEENGKIVRFVNY